MPTPGVIKLAACLSILSALSCGGSKGAAGAPLPSLSLTTNTVSATTWNNYGPISPTVGLVVSGSYAGDLYLFCNYTTNGISSVTKIDQSPGVFINFKSGSALAPGVYSDTVTLSVTTDAAGTVNITNSPQTLTATLTWMTGPPPTLATLSPCSAPAGAPAFTIAASGTNFTQASTLLWNNTALPTTYVSPTLLTGQVPASALTTSGNPGVFVSNGAEGGDSSTLPFAVQQPAFAIATCLPSLVQAGCPSFTLTVNGALFDSSAVVQWNGSPRPTTFVSPFQLTAQIGSTDIGSPGAAGVTVLNPAGQGGTSNTVPVTIQSLDAVAYQINPAHTGTIAFRGMTLPAGSAWSVNLGGAPSNPLIAHGLVYATVFSQMADNTQLIALDQTTGATVWGPVTFPGTASAAYDSGQVFVLYAADEGNGATVQAFDAATGTSQWSTPLAGEYHINGAPTAYNGFVYAGASGYGYALYALNEASGAIAWSTFATMDLDNLPAVTPDGVYLSCGGLTDAINPTNGNLLWTNKPSNGSIGSDGYLPVVANGIVYAPNGQFSFDGQAMNAETGTIVANYNACLPPAISAERGFFLQQDRTLTALSLADFTVLWSFSGDGGLDTSPIVVNDTVFVGSSNGNLYALDAATGIQVWMMNVGAPVAGGISYPGTPPYSGLSAGDGLVVVPAGNTLTAFLLSANP